MFSHTPLLQTPLVLPHSSMSLHWSPSWVSSWPGGHCSRVVLVTNHRIKDTYGISKQNYFVDLDLDNLGCIDWSVPNNTMANP